MVLLLSLAPLGGCGSTIASLPVVGAPAEAPKPRADRGEFPAVHDIPQDRDEKTMGAAEQQALEQELKTARDNQASVSSIDGFKPVPKSQKTPPKAKAQ